MKLWELLVVATLTAFGVIFLVVIAIATAIRWYHMYF